MLVLILQLLIAHIIGDFVLQPDSWVAAKKHKKHASKYLYLHGLVHLILLMVLVPYSWYYLLLIVICHLIIDIAKLHLERLIDPKIAFVIDQIAHLLVLAGFVQYITPFSVHLQGVYTEKLLLLVFALLCVTFVSAIIMKLVMSKWSIDEPHTDKSLKHAGLYIGILERLFVFAFVVLNQWGAIGFLIAAKSVFRFGDLSKAEDRKLTEYVLIGSLYSFGLATLIGLLYRYMTSFL